MSSSRSLTLFVIRHGECLHNVQARYAGQSDTPLTSLGKEQATACAKVLKEMALGVEKFSYVSSPLDRATTTMKIILSSLGLPPSNYSTDSRLKELDFGDNTSRLIDEVRDSVGPITSHNVLWKQAHPNGESPAQLYDRVGRFLHDLTENTIAVCHSGSARMIRAHVLRLSESEALSFKPALCEILVFQIAKGFQPRTCDKD